MRVKKQNLSDKKVIIKRRIITRALIALIPIIALSSILCLSGCENYVLDEDFNSIVTKNDIDAEFEIKKEKNNKYKITSYKDIDNGRDYIEIDVKSNLSITCGRIPIEPDKSYRLSIVMKNHSSDPLLLYSFWEDPIKQSRSFTLAGENGNPPISETQEVHQEWVTFTEIFQAEEKESYFKISILSNSGIFYIKSIFIEEITGDRSS